MIWDVASCEMGKEYQKIIDGYLADGWEPFAVVYDAGWGAQIMHFKKLVKK